jgi:hypothetical protein
MSPKGAVAYDPSAPDYGGSSPSEWGGAPGSGYFFSSNLSAAPFMQ